MSGKLKRKLKLLSCLLLAALLSQSLAVGAHAETSYGEDDWWVTFTTEKKMESSFKTSNLNDVIMGLQPGDNAIITLALRNDNAATTNWYMTNKVLYSLEDRSANSRTGGGAYTYRLVYTDKDGEENVLFDSDTVGGEDTTGGEGLHEATSALQDYFFLDTLTTGQSGTITLEVALDGETQGNDYQDTLADLQMNFAVELDESTPTTPGDDGDDEDRSGDEDEDDETGRRRTTTVRTSDESDALSYIVIMAVSGVVLLAIAVYGWKENRKERTAKGGGTKR